MSMICADTLRRWFQLPSLPRVALSFIARRFLAQTFPAKTTIPGTKISYVAQTELAENGIMRIPRSKVAMAVYVVLATSMSNTHVRTLGPLGFGG
jgi:hypothetical protein